MMNQQQWPQLPLFLHTLEEKGFVLLAERYEFVLQIAQRSPDFGDLKLRLGALLSSSPQQQQQFAEWFEQFFNPNFSTATTNAEQERQKEEWLRMQGALDRQIERTVQESPAGKSNRSFYPSRTFFILLMLGFVLFVYFYYAGFGLIAFVGVIGALITFALIEDRKPESPFTLRREAIAPPSSFFDIHIPTYAEVRFGRAFQGIARRLRQRLPTDQPVLDVPTTIRKSITQGGFFTPQYLYRSKAPAYLLLIDQSSVANHRFQLAELLYNWLHRQDIEVERFWYRNDPRTCWNEAHPAGISLEQLAQRYAESQLLLFGDGWQLLNLASQKLQPWAHAFAQWENRTLVTPIAPPAWTRKETQLAQLFILAPASVEGLRYWSESMLPQTEQRSAKAPVWQEKAVFITKENFLTALHQHFPNERLREWLCALACFPVLNWELTLRIGAVLSQKHGMYLLDYSNLRRLTRISWFYNGYIPEEMRELLYQQLDPEIAKLIHQCIVQILAEQVEDGRQHFNLSQGALALQIAVQQVATGMFHAKNLVKYVWNNNSSTENQDFLVLNHFYSAPYNIKVPNSLVKLLHQHSQKFYTKFLLSWVDIKAENLLMLSLYKKIFAFFNQYFFRKNLSIPQNENLEPSQEDVINRIRSHIATDDISAALKRLIAVTHNSDLQEEAIILSSHFYDLERSIRMGIFGSSDRLLQRNKIVIRILDLCAQLSKLNDLNETLPVSETIPVTNEGLKSKLENEQIFNTIRVQASKGELENAIKMLIAITRYSDQLEEAKLLNANYHELEQSYKEGILSYDDFEQNKFQVAHFILELCNKIQFPTSPFQPKPAGKKIFISYSKSDKAFLEEFLAHLSPLKRSGKISSWYDREIDAEDEWDENIMTELKTADIILLLVSAYFTNSEYSWGKEITLAMERHERREALIIPVFMKPCKWDNAPFRKLNGLPSKGKPVSAYADRDEAWLEVVKGIERVMEK